MRRRRRRLGLPPVTARTRLAAKVLRIRRRPLTAAQRACATEMIAEEIRTGKYPLRQAVAIGLARARREC